MKKKRKRLVTGRFITQKQLPKERPSLGEIAEGQKEKDARPCGQNSEGSPYWDWMEKHGQRTEDGDIIESPLANPDVLANDEVVPSNTPSQADIDYVTVREGIDSVLTEKERHIMVLVIDGFSQDKIAHNLGIKQQSVSQHIRIARKKLDKYLRENIVE